MVEMLINLGFTCTSSEQNTDPCLTEILFPCTVVIEDVQKARSEVIKGCSVEPGYANVPGKEKET